MKLARESAYGIEGLVALAAKPSGQTMPLRDIASAGGVPQSFLAKIFQKLTRYGIVNSFRGAGRGYALARPPREIKLKDILLAIEGPDLFERCIFLERPLRRFQPLSAARTVEANKRGGIQQANGWDNIGRPREESSKKQRGENIETGEVGEQEGGIVMCQQCGCGP